MLSGSPSNSKGETAMKKISYVLITFVSVLALMVASVDARGREGGGGGGGHGRSHVGGAIHRSGGGSGGGGAAIHRGGNRGTTKQFTPSVNRSSNIRSTPSSQFRKQSSGGYSKPTFSGQRQFRGKQELSAVNQPQPQGQVQRFLNMPNSGAAQTRTGFGKVALLPWERRGSNGVASLCSGRICSWFKLSGREHPCERD